MLGLRTARHPVASIERERRQIGHEARRNR
jgi:hypothetical protein